MRPGGGGVRPALLEAFRAALAAVDPASAVRARLPHHPLSPPITVLALGKAAAGMAAGAMSVLGEQVEGGVVVSHHPAPVPPPLRSLTGGHPLPDDRSFLAGSALLEAAGRATGSLLVLLSGGGSAIAEVPVEGLEPGDLVAAHRGLLLSGLPIEEANLVRRHLSRLKDGGLLRAARVPVVTLLISDVVDAPASVVASGPTLPDGSSPAAARQVLERHADLVEVPPAVPAVLARLGGPAPSDGPAHRWEVVADVAMAVRAAVRHLSSQGWSSRLRTTRLRGAATEATLRFVEGWEPGVVDVAGGETTVRVHGDGTGGRNQHAALAAALLLERREACFAALATDGQDGPTDAAGAVVDGGTADRARAAGLEPEAALAAFDSHPTLEAAGDLVRTGPTGTNVGDLWLGWTRR